MRGSDAQIFGLERGTLEKSAQEDKENDVKIKWEMVYPLKQS